MTSVISISGKQSACVPTSLASDPRNSGGEPVIIVLSPEASPSDIDHIVGRIEETGRQAHISSGTERTIIGVIGPDDLALQDMFETMAHVESVHRVTKPYKLVSRE